MKKTSRAADIEKEARRLLREFEASLDAEVAAWMTAAMARLRKLKRDENARSMGFKRTSRSATTSAKTGGTPTGRTRRPPSARGGHMITHTLIVFPQPLRQILSGRKTWEVRTRRTQTGRRIGLSEKGAAQIRGSCRVHKIHGPLSFSQALRHARKMGTTRESILANPKWWKDKAARGTLFAWELTAVRSFKEPVPFKTPPGAQTWAVLPARISSRIR